MQMQPIDTNKLKKLIDSKNIAEILDYDKLSKISSELKEGIEFDDNSRSEWTKLMGEALSLARQDLKTKDHPWEKASNVKIPLITSACIQFNSRIVPEIIQGNNIVNVVVMRDDGDDEYIKRAYHQGRHMSYQLLNVIDNWVPDTDKLLMSLPLLGTVYRKSYFDTVNRVPCADLCLPDDVIINQSCSSLKKAQRITHKLTLSTNDIIERMRSGIYKSYDLDKLQVGEDKITRYDSENVSTGGNISSYNDPYHQIYESHCWLDLDDDNYREPYIVTIHSLSGKILRIKARYDNDSWIKEENNDIIGIEGRQYFTDYRFMPSPDGAFMGLGFGQLLYPMNESINSLVNQLVDAGHLNNLQCGFISRALKIKKERLRFSPGEWAMINTPSGVSLSQSIMPLPTKEPSQTLFSLIEFLLQSARELAAISNPLQGQMPPPNTPATTVLSVIKEGQKQYSSVYRRVLSSLQKEFEKLYDINSNYLMNTETYVLARESGIVQRNQYDKKTYGVFPVADPSISSEQERLAKMQAIFNIKDDPNINEREVINRYIDLLNIPDGKSLLNPPPDPNSPPPPDVLYMMSKKENLDMQSKKIQYEMMVDAEHKAEQLHLSEKELNLNAMIAHDQATESRISSIIKLAEAESVTTDRDMSIAERQQLLVERQVALAYDDFMRSQSQNINPQVMAQSGGNNSQIRQLFGMQTGIQQQPQMGEQTPEQEPEQAPEQDTGQDTEQAPEQAPAEQATEQAPEQEPEQQ